MHLANTLPVNLHYLLLKVMTCENENDKINLRNMKQLNKFYHQIITFKTKTSLKQIKIKILRSPGFFITYTTSPIASRNATTFECL